MKLLVIGSGGREHALVWKLALSPHASRIWCAPGNAGIAQERLSSNGTPVECVDVAAEDLGGIIRLAEERKPDLTVVGPDNPLALGIVDLFQQRGLRIWGPNQRAAQFESSKIFAQEFMQRHGIPTARSRSFSDQQSAREFVTELQGRCAVKADGLALGKGVIICTTLDEAYRAIEQMLVEKCFGNAGSRIVIQELLEGEEISLHAICDGKTAKLFPTAQDHKRAQEGDRGLNTGGMGAYSPTPFLNQTELAAAGTKILEPWIKGCAIEGIEYKGVLFPGVMLTSDGPKVLEFNARFGDPETQVYLPRLETDLVELLEASMDGTLQHLELKWSSFVAVCVILASVGYPGAYARGKRITGLEEVAKLPGTKVFHGGTAREQNSLVTNGGRVLGVTAWAADLRMARAAAYEAVEKIEFDGAYFRRDIGHRALG